MLVASRLMDHAKAVVSIVNVGPAFDERVCGALGIVEFSGLDEGDHRIGGGVDFGVAIGAEAGVMVRQMIRRRGAGSGPAFRPRRKCGQFVLGEAT